MSPNERFAKAVSIFLSKNPRAANEINRLSPNVAEDLGITLEQLQKETLHRLFGEHATSMGMDVSLLVFDLTASSPVELHELKSTYYRSLATALGLSWEEYISHNPHLACF